MYICFYTVRMLLHVGFTALRQELASKLDQVEKGDTILVERRGKVIAKIVPVDEPKKQPSWKRKLRPIPWKGGSIQETMDYIRSESWRE